MQDEQKEADEEEPKSHGEGEAKADAYTGIHRMKEQKRVRIEFPAQSEAPVGF